MHYEPSTQTTFASLADFRLAYPLTSFGPLATESDRNAVGLFDVVQIPPAYDADLQEITLTGVEQVGDQWHATYTVTDKPLTPEQIAAITRSRSKAARAVAVGNIKVTTEAGNTFDGDETS
jgi:hypothetical protein